MIAIVHPWTEWQEIDAKSDDLFAWKWKDNTPEEIIKQYEEWKQYYDKTMKFQI